MHFSRPARWSAMFASLTCLAACGLEEDPSITDAAGAADIFRFVTGHARAALNSEGLFETTLREELPGGPDEIPEIEAHRQALAWARVYGESARVYLEPQHGAPIDPDNLEVCNRTFYAASRFRPLPEVVPDPERRMFGPWWFVQLCVGEVPQVLIAVSAYNQGLVNTAGEFEYPRYAGNHFFPYGIPDARLEKLMILPEQAVRLASETAGVPISSLPELVMSHRGVFEAQWRFTLNETNSPRQRAGYPE